MVGRAMMIVLRGLLRTVNSESEVNAFEMVRRSSYANAKPAKVMNVKTGLIIGVAVAFCN